MSRLRIKPKLTFVLWIALYFAFAFVVMVILGNTHGVDPRVPAFGYRVVLRLQNIVFVWVLATRVLKKLREDWWQ